MTKHPDLFAALAAPFDSTELKVRTQAGRQIQYVTARTIMNRLDTVLGPENWFDRFHPGENSVLCELTIRLPDGSTLTKCDAGGYAGMADSGDDEKSGFSDSFKRAAVKFGVARYLYRDGVPSFAAEQPEPAREQPKTAPTKGRGPGNDPPAPTGRALYDFALKAGKGLLRHLTHWGRERAYPARVIDWDHAQYKAGFVEANRYLSQQQQSGAA